jgi:hypothetical protein
MVEGLRPDSGVTAANKQRSEAAQLFCYKSLPSCTPSCTPPCILYRSTCGAVLGEDCTHEHLTELGSLQRTGQRCFFFKHLAELLEDK